MKVKILVLDDSGLARRLIRKILEVLGREVEEVSDGAQALERYVLSHPGSYPYAAMCITGLPKVGFAINVSRCD